MGFSLNAKAISLFVDIYKGGLEDIYKWGLEQYFFQLDNTYLGQDCIVGWSDLALLRDFRNRTHCCR